MNTYIVLIRGINVGGKNSIKMAALKEVLFQNGLSDIKTYIQSGNVVVSSDADEPKHIEAIVEKCLMDDFGIAASVMCFDSATFETIVKSNPFKAVENAEKNVHIAFFERKIQLESIEHINQSLKILRAETECFEMTDGAFYLHAPDGIGRSKLVARLEKSIGINITMRNLRTISAIEKLI